MLEYTVRWCAVPPTRSAPPGPQPVGGTRTAIGCFAVDRPMFAFVKLDSLSYCCNYLALFMLGDSSSSAHPAQLGIHISGKANHVLDCRVFHR